MAFFETICFYGLKGEHRLIHSQADILHSDMSGITQAE